MNYISKGIIKKPLSLTYIKPLTLEMISKFLKEKCNNLNISEKVLLKLDVDSDALEQSVNFTFDDCDILEEFNNL